MPVTYFLGTDYGFCLISSVGYASRVYFGYVGGSKGNMLREGELVGTDQGTKIDGSVLRSFLAM